MNANDSMTAFAAFRDAVFDNFHLAMRRRRSLERGVFVAQAIAPGAAHGFVFDEGAVNAAAREGQTVWHTPGAEAP